METKPIYKTKLSEDNLHFNSCFSRFLNCANGTKSRKASPFVFRYKEEHYYNYLKGRAKNKKSVIGHFTQIVWKDTTRLGVGIASKFERQDSGIRYFNSYVVARYLKPGNVEGQYRQKVMSKVEDGMY